MKAMVVLIVDNLPDGYTLLRLGLEVRPGNWRRHDTVVRLVRPVRVGQQLEVTWIDPDDPTKGLEIMQ